MLFNFLLDFFFNFHLTEGRIDDKLLELLLEGLHGRGNPREKILKKDVDKIKWQC